jgi:iron complex transport system ATP-binding protein
VLEPFSQSIDAARLVCLLGANGTGKSTVLRTLAGLQASLGGELRLAQQPLSGLSPAARARLLALVLTDRVAVPSMKGEELVALGRYPYTGWSGRLSSSDRAIIHEVLEATGSAALAGRFFVELSDGERQRLLVARALAQEPRVLMLDEPTAFLDLPRRVELMHLLRRIARARGIAILMSSHDLELALRYADEIWLLDGAGYLRAGAPEDLVLSGHLEAAFGRHGLVFDVERGTLHVAEQPRGAVQIDATGKVRHWLAHAARRAGLEVLDTAPATIRVGESGYHLVRENAAPIDVASIRHLVDALEGGHP